MKYVSTRGSAPVLGFGDTLLTGLASDGGLYVPETWPRLPDRWDEVRPYHEVATAVMWPFVEGAVEHPQIAPQGGEGNPTDHHPAVWA
ncbi:MAG TPA: threonine synthase, partial [Acidimicrobiales bacterium]|nr:threonine synthase [Acidimicrobiales bacterium]